MKRMGVKKLRTTGYNPQANGLIEESMSIVKNYLTAFTSKNPQNMDNFYRELAFAYNTSVHSSTGFTPAHLFYGRLFNVPLNIFYGNIETSERYNSYEQFQNNIYEFYNLARENMNTRQKVSSTYYDKKVRDDKLDIGDKVFVYLPRNGRAKLKYKWMGLTTQHTT